MDINSPQANQGIAHDVLNAHAQSRHSHARDDKLEDEDSDTSSHTTSEGGKAQEQYHASLPRDTRPTVAERVGAEALLLDRVDDEHAQTGEDEGQPINKLDMDIRAVVGRLGPDGGVEHDVKGDGELRVAIGLASCAENDGMRSVP